MGSKQKTSYMWLVQASSLGNNHDKQSDNRLAWIIFNKKIKNYRDMKQKDTPKQHLKLKT